MAEIPQITPVWSGAVALKAEPYLADHHLQGRPVIPAVESLRLLAGVIEAAGLRAEAAHCRDADFLRFIPAPPTGSSMELLVDLFKEEGGAVKAVLSTKSSSKNGAITRTKKHVSVLFGQNQSTSPPPLDVLAVPEGVGLTFSSQTLYKQLVPFGPSFQNAAGPAFLTPGGASGLVRAPADLDGSGPLGSPFPLDAAFHLASAWGQSRFGLTGFPVGFESRRIFDPARPGETFFARVIPGSCSPESMKFDLWLLDPDDGRLRESVHGLQMKDVTGGRLLAPEWVREKPAPALEALKDKCRGLVVMEIDALAPFARQSLSPREVERSANMGEKRLKSFIASRIALKRLSRLLSGPGHETPARDLDVLAPDGVKPGLAGSDLFCSASHDHRFVTAAASERPIGIDVETHRESAVRGLSIFASEEEKELAEKSRLGIQSAAVRLWTIKEAAAKALGAEQPHVWRRSNVVEIGPDHSRVVIDGGEVIVWHADVDGHIFSLLTL